MFSHNSIILYIPYVLWSIYRKAYVYNYICIIVGVRERNRLKNLNNYVHHDVHKCYDCASESFHSLSLRSFESFRDLLVN